MKIGICVIIDLIGLYVLRHFFSLIEIPVEIYQNRKLALSLARNDFKTKYAGSYLGMVWAFIQPIVTIAVYWFVFSVGFRAGAVGEYPYVLFIVVGIIPWFFFSDALNGGTSAMTDYNYLVKKVVFNIDILPFVKVVSALFVHCFFIIFALILSICLGYPPTIYTVQLLYYVVCSVIFVLGLSYLTSSIVVFFRDLGQFINIFILQVGVWLTPIMWNADSMLSPTVHKFFKLNPMYYIVSGFRDSILAHHWFFQGETLLWTIYFWTVTLLVFGLGVKVFRRLKIHFADVL
ncbi:MAG: ABC transporter permease [Eubacterium sp.]|nr:ABC transporter permease [Eubacterium sp.]